MMTICSDFFFIAGKGNAIYKTAKTQNNEFRPPKLDESCRGLAQTAGSYCLTISLLLLLAFVVAVP